MTDQQLEMMFNLFSQMMGVQADGLLGISANLDAVKKVVCELHPEAASRLEIAKHKSSSVH